jgi:hypothetical protein
MRAKDTPIHLPNTQMRFCETWLLHQSQLDTIFYTIDVIGNRDSIETCQVFCNLAGLIADNVYCFSP